MRKTWIDYLRIISAIGVIVVHVTGEFYDKFGEIEQPVWWMANVLNASSRFPIALFIMISGAVLLGKNDSIGEFYKKRAVRFRR